MGREWVMEKIAKKKKGRKIRHRIEREEFWGTESMNDKTEICLFTKFAPPFLRILYPYQTNGGELNIIHLGMGCSSNSILTHNPIHCVIHNLQRTKGPKVHNYVSKKSFKKRSVSPDIQLLTSPKMEFDWSATEAGRNPLKSPSSMKAVKSCSNGAETMLSNDAWKDVGSAGGKKAWSNEFDPGALPMRGKFGMSSKTDFVSTVNEPASAATALSRKSPGSCSSSESAKSTPSRAA